MREAEPEIGFGTVRSVALVGTQCLPVTVETQISRGLPQFSIVGLPDKAVGESKDRVRAALLALNLALPARRMVTNLSPADLPKEGTHLDLAILVSILVAQQVLPQEDLSGWLILGELGLDGSIRPVPGGLPAAMAAVGLGLGLICPAATGPEAAWASESLPVLAASSIGELLAHFREGRPIPRPERRMEPPAERQLDLAEVVGQGPAKRALEIAAAGGHNLLMVGPPGSGKSMLAKRLPTILPPLTPREALDVTIIHSVAGLLGQGHLIRTRPFRDPHHSASMAALIGGGNRVKPGEVSLAHMGVLFLDELAEFVTAVLEALRQPIESGVAMVARANMKVSYPAVFQLIAAMNPCRCGHFGDPTLQCRRAPGCAEDYSARISGPILDRIDLFIGVTAMAPADMLRARPGEPSAAVAARVAAARDLQLERCRRLGLAQPIINARAEGPVLDRIAQMTEPARDLLLKAADRLKLSARAFHRVMRVARTIADLAGSGPTTEAHLGEALAYRDSAVLVARQSAARR